MFIYIDLNNIAMEQELIHRLKMIVEDANILLEHLQGGNSLEDPTRYADSGSIHLSNIQIASDLKDDESLSWNSFKK